MLFALILSFVFFIRPIPIHHPVGNAVAILLAGMVFYTLYDRRYFLREMTWASEIYHVRIPSLFLIGTVSFLAGLVLMVIAVVLSREESPQFSQKLLFALIYGLAYPCFTACFTLLALEPYLLELDESVPQPVFAQPDRLLEIVFQAAVQDARGKMEPSGTPLDPGNFEVVAASRNLINGGINMLLRECKPVVQPRENAYPVGRWIERIWAVEADKWGRIRSLMPRPNQQHEFWFPYLKEPSGTALLTSGGPSHGR